MTNPNTTADDFTATTPDCVPLWDAVLADPPWQGMGGEKYYPTMSLARIAGMGDAVKAHTKPDSWLFLWTTKRLEQEAKRVMADWGYEEGDSIVWGKLNRFGFGKKHIGVRHATEILLIGTRGNVASHYRAQPDFFISPAGRHAEKPLEQYAIIERTVGPEARVLELFARVRRPDPRYGFWGNELDRCDVNFTPWGYEVPGDEHFLGHGCDGGCGDA